MKFVCCLAFVLSFINATFLSSEFALGQKADSEKKVKFAIVIHGGAGAPASLPEDERKAAEAALEKALKIGVAELEAGAKSLDVVEKVIRLLEDDPVFNAGKGAVYNAAGGHELDASIMDGETLACGAVAGVKTVKNPIGLARLVMTKTRHVLLTADGAEKFADKMGVDRVENSYFATEPRRLEWEQVKKAQKSEDHKGTVGCAVLDTHGNLAAGTSTGGLTNKMFGRVGDSPIIGAGTYADNKTCAVSCTGIGEQFIRNSVARDVSARMEYAGQSLEEAIKTILEKKLRKGDGGIIAVSHDGKISMQFNTDGMFRAAADSNGRFEIKY